MDHAAVLDALGQYFGHSQFRPGQEGLVQSLLQGRDVLGVMPTGAGKSVCYQLPALLLPGITLVVSPLISLMKDQVAALKEAGIPAAYLNSSLNPAQQREALRRAELGAYKLIYVAPERLLTDSFLSFAVNQQISLLAVDEAHCVSQWGQDFRQNYLDIPVFVQRLPRRPVLAAFTATATEELRADIVRLLQLQDPCSVTTGFDRPNLFFDVRRESGKLEWLKNYLRTRQTRSGIVYCSTRKTVDQVCQILQEAGFAATRYHAGLEDEERRCNQEDFAFDRATVMVATNAFGMGIDKSNVSFVIHYNMPKNMESYYQEAGRAGRDGSPADCILLYSPGDVVTARYLITEGSDREQVPEPLREVLLQRDLSRLRQMTEYCKTEGCFRAALLEYFGESHSADCGNCGNCRPVADELQGESVEEDITLAAQKILSCLRRVERKNRVGLGESTIVSILAGSREKRILKWEYDLLPTYGLMRDVKRTLLRQYIQELRRQGFLHLSSGDFDVLTTTGEADKVLFHGQQVLWRHRIDAGTSSTAAGRQLVPGAGKKRLDAGSSELFEQLRALRAELARQANVPAYVILPDATLLELAQKQPTTPELLAGISGLGEKRIERYGAALLELLQSWRAQREANWTLDRGSYPGNLLYDIFEEAAFLPQDVEARLQKTLDTLLDASGREILLRAYRDQKHPAEIGAEQSLSEERIQQNLEQSLRKLRRKSSRAYLRGDSEHLAHGRETQPSLRLRADQLAGYVCKPEGISVTSFARSLTELKEAGQEGSLSGSQLFDWLLERGLLTERLSEADALHRRPTPEGEALGIRLETRSGQSGERFTMIVLTESAQRWLIAEFCRSASEEAEQPAENPV